MKKRIALLFLVCFAFGCGGGGGSSTPSPFQGTWIGTWDSPSAGANGTANITIALNGQVTGTVHDNVANADGTVTGSISNSGNVNAQVQYPPNPSNQLTGALSIAQNGHLTGNLIQHVGQSDFGVSFDLTPQ